MIGKVIKISTTFAIIIGVIVFVLNSNLDKNDYKYCNLEKKTNSCKKADAIVVISGGDTKARTIYGVNLFDHGIGKNKIIFSGAAKDENSISNAKAMKNIALKKRVNDDKIIIEEKSKNTHENAVNVAKIIKEQEIKSIVLVTSGYHQLRAYKEFRNKIPKDVKIYNAPVKKDNDWSPNWFLNSRGWELAIKEFIAATLVRKR